MILKQSLEHGWQKEAPLKIDGYIVKIILSTGTIKMKFIKLTIGQFVNYLPRLGKQVMNSF